MPAKSKRIAQIIPIAPRIEQERLLRIVILEWLIREEKEEIREALLAGATICPGPVRAEVQGRALRLSPRSGNPKTKKGRLDGRGPWGAA